LHFVWHLLKDLVVRTAGSYLREQSLLVMVVKLREHWNWMNGTALSLWLETV